MLLRSWFSIEFSVKKALSFRAVDSAAFMAKPDYWDLMTKEKIEKKDAFVEQLTHIAYFIQTKRIKPSFNSRLEKLLTTFEQARFLGNDETTKIFPFEAEEKDMKEFLSILQYVAADEKMRKELAREMYNYVELESLFGAKDAKIAEQAEQLMEKDKELSEKDKELSEKDKELAEKEKELSEKDKEYAKLIERIAELERKVSVTNNKGRFK